MSIQRLRCEWSGNTVVGPGLTTFFAEADGTTAVYGFANQLFDGLAPYLPTGTTISIPQQGDVLDEATGELTGGWGAGVPSTKTGTGAGAYASGVGARLTWQTLAIHAGRRVRGSTFVVPIRASAYDEDGTLDAAAIADFETAIGNAMTMIGTRLRVWSRPVPGRPGIASSVVGGQAPDRVSWLRSRRT